MFEYDPSDPRHQYLNEDGRAFIEMIRITLRNCNKRIGTPRERMQVGARVSDRTYRRHILADIRDTLQEAEARHHREQFEAGTGPKVVCPNCAYADPYSPNIVKPVRLTADIEVDGRVRQAGRLAHADFCCGACGRNVRRKTPYNVYPEGWSLAAEARQEQAQLEEAKAALLAVLGDAVVFCDSQEQAAALMLGQALTKEIDDA